ncbi:unnamed protein product [Somion occarium]|uniref:Uncharacterized protein n=1 Tax=Somion occarium TaxID=3059160 RepID=A0ABP1DK19_9APHY
MSSPRGTLPLQHSVPLIVNVLAMQSSFLRSEGPLRIHSFDSDGSSIYVSPPAQTVYPYFTVADTPSAKSAGQFNHASLTRLLPPQTCQIVFYHICNLDMVANEGLKNDTHISW